MPQTVDVKETEFTRRFRFIKDADLIKVKTIKKKYVDQLPEWEVGEIPIPPGADIIGRADFWIVVRRGKILGKVHHMKMVGYIRDEILNTDDFEGSYTDANDEAFRFMDDDIDQLFQD